MSMGMKTILHGYIATGLTTWRREEAIVLYGMISTMLPGVVRLIVRFGIRLRRFLLIDTATLLLVSSAL